MPSRLLVIFDLDETLVRTSPNSLAEPGDFFVDAGRVRRRPGLEAMLRAVACFADVAVWSSAGDTYVADVVREIVPADIALRFVWARSRCTSRRDDERWRGYWVKDLKKAKNLGFPLERILMVDDSPEMVERNYGNHVRIEPFHGDLEDRVLPELTRYLATFENVDNVRFVEKRGWNT